jgi:hypothetical protein
MLKKVDNFDLSLMGKQLTPSPSAKDLGVILDSHLTFNEHVSYTAACCMSRLAQINRVKHCFNRHTLIVLINALVLSKLFYCSSVWSNTTETNLNKIQAVQNFASKIVLGGKKYDHVTPILKELKWLPIRQQLYLRKAILVFKCMNGMAPSPLADNFVKRSYISGRQTRNSQLLNIPLLKTSTGQRSFYYRGVKLWNDLSDKIKLCKNVDTFKRAMRSKLLNEFL